jgi:hypothetical protein
MTIMFRAATTEDFDYCASLYFAGMATVIGESTGGSASA